MRRDLRLGFVIALARGVLAITLGIVLVFNPEKTRSFLFNTMGLFWLTSGLVLVRRAHPVLDRGAENAMGKRTSVLLGTIGVLAGLLVLTRTLSVQVVPEVLVFELLGAVILLTGILHLIGQFRIGRIRKLGRTTGHKILAIFEIVLGVLLIKSPLERSPVVYWVATVWALVAGIAIIGDALYARSREREETQPDAI